MKKFNRQAVQLTKTILLFLAEMGEMAPELFETRRDYLRRLGGYPRQIITKQQIDRSLRQLRRQRLIRKKENREKIVYEITDLGRAKNLKWNYKRKPKVQRLDGLSTIVIFDIPESKKKSRDFIRRFLKDNDFTQLQESVFISRFNLLDEFKDLTRELGITEHVTVMEGRIPHK